MMWKYPPEYETEFMGFGCYLFFPFCAVGNESNGCLELGYESGLLERQADPS